MFMFPTWSSVCACVYALMEQIYVFVFVFQQEQGNPFYSGQLRPSSHKVNHQWRRKSCKNQNTSGSKLATGGCERQGGCGVLWWGLQRPTGSTQRITMVTAIRGAQGREAWSERKAWEAADWGISPHSGWFNWQLPPRLCWTSYPQRPWALQNRDVASSLFLKEKKNGIEAKAL